MKTSWHLRDSRAETSADIDKNGELVSALRIFSTAIA